MPDSYDVIVIGGGFAGATAARECAKSGLRTLVLEARERLGGRTHTVEWNGTVTELGGTWIHWTQPYVWAEIERYGIALADSSLPVELRSRRGDGEVAPVDFLHALLPAVAQYFGLSRAMFPRPYAPFETGLAEQHDRVTAADPLASIDDARTRDFLDGFVATCVGSRAEESAWIEMLRWHTLAGHNYFDHVEALGRYRLRDGTKALIDAIVADGKPDVRLGEAVASVRQESARVTITTRSGRELAARAVVSTLPLNVLRDVAWEPGLDPRKLEASVQRHAGASTKIHALVEGEHRVSCVAPSPHPLNSLLTAHVGHGTTHLIGFGPSAELLDVNDAAQIERAVRGLLPDAKLVEARAWDWNADEFARGTWCTLRPGQFGRNLAALQQPAGRVFFASADWASGWRGNIDGAIEQGLTAARHVRAWLA